MKKRRFAFVGIVAAIVLLSACAANAQLSVGTKAPDFTLPTLHGNKFTLSDCFKNKSVVVLDLWATWCPPCKAEIPYLIDLQDDYRNTGDVKIVGVAIDQEKRKIEGFAKDKGINYTIALDYGAEKIGSSYKIVGIPITYVIDKKGVIRYVHSGFPRDETSQKKEIAKLKNEIKTLQKEK